ncbi:MAG: cytochrome c [Planctomycetia bacterium]|nr:cytochrome c [Planctomycetia bacterium]
MKRPTHRSIGLLALGIVGWAVWPEAQAQVTRLLPRPEPVAETSLLMEGLAQANFRGLNQNLRQQPGDVESWVFIRGQALLVAETGNLLMVRPPRSGGQDAWLEHAAEMRAAATRLARAAAAEDYARSRQGLAELANTCNRCHQKFRITVRIPLKDQ